MFDCMKKKDPVVTKPVHPTSHGTPKFFIVVGHNKKSQGAVNYLGESEYYFNKRVATKLQRSLDLAGIDAYMILRPVGNYGYQCSSVASQIEKIANCELSYGINLHFNDASESARGSESWLKGTYDNFDNFLGKTITDRLELIGIKERGDDGVRILDRKHNGYGMVNAMTDVNCTTVLIEPCFGGYENKESKAIFENEDRYVSILSESVIASYNMKGYRV